MAFEISVFEAMASGGLHRSRCQTVRLAGQGGFFSRYVPALSLESGSMWSLAGQQVARQLAPDSTQTEAWELLLASTGSPNLLFWVQWIIGRSTAEETEIVMQGEYLRADPMGLWQRTGREGAEALALRGGFSTPNAAWSWTAPKLALGGVILSPVAGASVK